MSTSSDIQLIRQDLEYIKIAIQKIESRYDKHIEESFEYRKKVDEIAVGGNASIQSLLDKLSEHIIWDKWLFGIIVSLLLFVGGKLLSAGH